MLEEEQGVKAIIALQAVVGVVETEENALIGWNAMADWEKESTEAAHEIVCGGFDKTEERDETSHSPLN